VTSLNSLFRLRKLTDRPIMNMQIAINAVYRVTRAVKIKKGELTSAGNVTN